MSSAAAILAETGNGLSYDDLECQSVQLSHLLRSRGLTRGDRVAILLENRLEWFVAMWGVRRAGMFFVPINWHLKPTEIRHVVVDSDARAIITSETLTAVTDEACRALDPGPLRLSVDALDGDDIVSLPTVLASFPDSAEGRERDGGSMLYSSGTTGYPKGIMRPSDDGHFGQPSKLETMLTDINAVDRATVYLSPAPMYHASPVGFTGTVLRNGGTVILMSTFDAEAVLTAIERYGVTHAQFVPTHFIRMLKLPPAVRDKYDLSSLRRVIHAAAPCPPEVKRQMIDWLGPILSEYYAGSEGCGLTSIETDEWLTHPGSVGRSRTSPIHIIDLESGVELPTGEIGGVYFESPGAFAYHKDPQKTATALTLQGWGTLGDIGRLDADGYLYLADRRSDLILSGGVNIYPQEVENALLRHPAVADAAVIGIPDAEFGQQVRAVVQLVPEAAPPDAAQIIAFAREHVAHFKAPRSVVFCAALPRMPNGKLLRRLLIDEHRANEEPA